jgi:hypothetical protein
MTLGPSIPGVVLVGNPDSSIGYTIRDFLSRNGVPDDWVDLEDVERLPVVVSPRGMDPGLLPKCILPNGIRLGPASPDCSQSTGVDEPQWRPVLFDSGCRPGTLFKVRMPMAAPLRLAVHRRQATGSES